MAPEPHPKGLGWQIGRAARWLRDHWVLTTTTALAALVALLVPFLFVDAEGQLDPRAQWALIMAGAAAILATTTDKIADAHDKRETDRAKQAEINAVSNSLIALSGLLDSTHDLAFTEGRARSTSLENLRISLIQSAQSAPTAADVRATFYPLTRDEDGWRQLCNPKSRGRADEASTLFFERDNPDHPIWRLMSGKDSACAIHSKPDPTPRVDWASRPYKTFISVPVHADGVVFGMLSINAPEVGDLVEVDRLAVIAMARIMALTLALDTGSRVLNRMRDPSDTLGSRQGGATDV